MNNVLCASSERVVFFYSDQPLNLSFHYTNDIANIIIKDEQEKNNLFFFAFFILIHIFAKVFYFDDLSTFKVVVNTPY